MGAFLEDASAVEDDDPVGGLGGAEAVGDEDDGSALAQFADAVVGGLFGAGVEGGGGLRRRSGGVRLCGGRLGRRRAAATGRRRGLAAPLGGAEWVSRPSGREAMTSLAAEARASAITVSSFAVALAEGDVLAGGGLPAGDVLGQ